MLKTAQLFCPPDGYVNKNKYVFQTQAFLTAFLLFTICGQIKVCNWTQKINTASSCYYRKSNIQ